MPRRKSKPIRHRQYPKIKADTPEELQAESRKFVKLFRRDPVLRRAMPREAKLDYTKSVCERVWGCKGEDVFPDNSTETLYVCGGDGQFSEFTFELNPWYAEYVVELFKLVFPRFQVEEGYDGFSVKVPLDMC